MARGGPLGAERTLVFVAGGGGRNRKARRGQKRSSKHESDLIYDQHAGVNGTFPMLIAVKFCRVIALHAAVFIGLALQAACERREGQERSAAPIDMLAREARFSIGETTLTLPLVAVSWGGVSNVIIPCAEGKPYSDACVVRLSDVALRATESSELISTVKVGTR